MKFIIVAALIGVSLALPNPLWPLKFAQSFEQIYNIDGNVSNTTGILQYDWINNQYNVTRVNGRADPFCGTGKDAVCEHLVVDGDRYLHYPEDKSCCFCCDAAHGCGLLKPDWLYNAYLRGVVNVKGFDEKVLKWEIPGAVGDNWYYETIQENPLDRSMIYVQQGFTEVQIFNKNVTYQFPQVQIPSYCDKSKTCDYGFCNFFHQGKATPKMAEALKF